MGRSKKKELEGQDKDSLIKELGKKQKTKTGKRQQKVMQRQSVSTVTLQPPWKNSPTLPPVSLLCMMLYSNPLIS